MNHRTVTSYVSLPYPPPLPKDKTNLRNQNTIANGNTHRQTVTLLVQGTRSNGHNLGLVELLDAGLGQKDTAGSLGLGLDPLDQDSVEKRGERSNGTN